MARKVMSELTCRCTSSCSVRSSYRRYLAFLSHRIVFSCGDSHRTLVPRCVFWMTRTREDLRGTEARSRKEPVLPPARKDVRERE
jgi:hypothetical protein